MSDPNDLAEVKKRIADLEDYLGIAHHNRSRENLATIWEALEGYRENCISEDDETWSDICLAMAQIREDLGLPSEVEEEQEGR